ncbi:MAG: hypothetical protein J6O56_03735 [Bacilli bacterium]|nr:hypothetical protein [Bacilli bacterium]
MNKLVGYLKLRYIIDKNIDRNMAIMSTDSSKDCLARKNEISDMEFFNDYSEFVNIIKNMKNDERKVFVSMPKESNIDNYMLFNNISSDNMLAYFEKENNKTNCTLNKKSLKLKKEFYEKRSREKN